LGQRQAGRLDVLSRRVRSRVAGPQHDGQRFPGTARTVISEDGQGMEAERLLPRRRGLLLIRMRNHDGGIDIDRDQRPIRARRTITCQRPGPLTRSRPRFADHPQRPQPRPPTHPAQPRTAAQTA
jgi:hypothetical protein